MRTLFDTEEEEQQAQASEITLSTASLLGIFFGLVLICGVFFGFGYSMGRGSGQKAETRSADNIPATAPADSDEAVDSRPAANAAPVAAPAAEEPAPVERAAAPVAEKKDEPQPAVENPARPEPPPPGTTKPSAVKLPPAYVPPSDAPASASGKPMVQIAAVARAEDANVLVSALRQRGYGVVVRSEPQDKLLHVQVGPFADRAQAAAMKQKLLSDGYNAIIKQ